MELSEAAKKARREYYRKWREKIESTTMNTIDVGGRRTKTKSKNTGATIGKERLKKEPDKT